MEVKKEFIGNQMPEKSDTYLDEQKWDLITAKEEEKILIIVLDDMIKIQVFFRMIIYYPSV
jgi:hypothetical protein